jgi:putative ABC transport system permease protein
MRQFIDAWLGPRRFNLTLFCAFAAATLVLAMMGLYGLVSYVVSQRAREIGLRMAIGANARDVQRMFLREAATLGVLGSAAGVVLSIIVRPFIARMVASSPADASINPGIAMATVVLLIATVLLAAWLPARRASRIDPTLALRGQ